MLENATTFSSFSTNDVEKSREFYKSTLGLSVEDQMGGLQVHLANNAEVFIYPKPNHIAATFTVLNFLVPNIDEVVDALTAKGVTFEHYDAEYMKTDDKGIARGDGNEGPSGIAWFKDPAGNFLSIIEAKK